MSRLLNGPKKDFHFKNVLTLRPCFRLHDVRVASLSQAVVASMHQLGFSQGQIDQMLPRANIICREYRVGQGIPFHTDDTACDAVVLGLVLLNEAPQHQGLQFRKGEGKHVVVHTVQERPGTIFMMSHEARYSWRHGLASAAGRRVSVTVRFFKPKVLQVHMAEAGASDAGALEVLPGSDLTAAAAEADDWASVNAAGAGLPSSEEMAQWMPVAAGGNQGAPTVRITLIKNCDVRQRRPVVGVASAMDVAQLQTMARNKLSVRKARRFFDSAGSELTEGDALAEGTEVYVCARATEKFCRRPVDPVDAAAHTDAQGPQCCEFTTSLGVEPVVRRAARRWQRWRYPKLQYAVRESSGTRGPQSGAGHADAADADHMATPLPVEDLAQLADLLQSAPLSVPELRELVQELAPIVAQRRWCWTFRTEQWDTGRLTAAGVGRGTMGAPLVEWLEFVVQGQRALKGPKKRDGEMWHLFHGFNDRGTLALTPEGPRAVSAAVVSEEVWPPLRSAAVAGVGGHAAGRQSGTGGRGHAKEKNAYQSKRGIKFTDTLFLFAGTTWPSTYYRCRLALGGHVYTSAAHHVMAEQARIFGDAARWQELLDAGHNPAPHRAFDHKAPKTNQRRVQGFDMAVWQQLGPCLMFKATYEKYVQNPALLRNLLEVGVHRRIVEATDDPVWGCGIALGHPDACNPKKWRGSNQMGELLDDVAALLRMERSTASFSPQRVWLVQSHLLALGAGSEVLQAATGFARRALQWHPDVARLQGWPGDEQVRGVQQWCQGQLVQQQDPEHVVARLLRDILAATTAPAATNTHPPPDCLQHSGSAAADPNRLGSQAWYQTALYLLEGAAGLRRW